MKPAEDLTRRRGDAEDAECAFGATHKSRLRRKTVFGGSRHGHAGSQVNKFPFRRQGHAPRFAPFAWPDTKAPPNVTKMDDAWFRTSELWN
jgi:hypothetical protein